uniref:Uncharacterized protein n=1 Tax=Anopheles atroparvus TaxID=41427 RepID=A0AAG5CVJ8_ANOAO
TWSSQESVVASAFVSVSSLRRGIQSHLCKVESCEETSHFVSFFRSVKRLSGVVYLRDIIQPSSTSFIYWAPANNLCGL